MKLKFILGEKGNEKIEAQPFFKYKIELVDNNPDIIIIHHRLLTNKILNGNIPVIIIERADSSILFFDEVRRFIHHPNVLAVFKISTLRDKFLNNSKTWIGRYHCKLINDFAKLVTLAEPKTEISEDCLGKIHCVVPTSIQDRFLEYRNLNVNYEKNRRFDVNFVGVVNYSGFPVPNLINWHRQKAVEELNKIKTKKFVVQANFGEKPISDADYKQVMLDSKICLSPWGMGEWNYRDFHSLYTGSILLKPDTDHVVTQPVDLYSSDNYVRCRPDFLDLRDKIEYILDNWQALKKHRVQKRNMLVESWDFNRLSLDFNNKISLLVGSNIKMI